MWTEAAGGQLCQMVLLPSEMDLVDHPCVQTGTWALVAQRYNKNESCLAVADWATCTGKVILSTDNGTL